MIPKWIFFFSQLEIYGISQDEEARGELREPQHRLAQAMEWLSLLHCKEISIYLFPEKELHGISPNFHIHVSVSDQQYIFPRPVHLFSCSRIGRPIVGEYLFWSFGIVSSVWMGKRKRTQIRTRSLRGLVRKRHWGLSSRHLYKKGAIGAVPGIGPVVEQQWRQPWPNLRCRRVSPRRRRRKVSTAGQRRRSRIGPGTEPGSKGKSWTMLPAFLPWFRQVSLNFEMVLLWIFPFSWFRKNNSYLKESTVSVNRCRYACLCLFVLVFVYFRIVAYFGHIPDMIN